MNRYLSACVCLLLLVQPGCQQSTDAVFEATQVVQQTGSQPDAEPRAPASDEKPVNPLTRSLYDALPEADDLSDDDRDEARNLLIEADRDLTEAKLSGREAIRQINREFRLPDGESPNVILIVADDLAYGDLGCYGQQLIATPRIDALAAHGARFTSFYAGSSVGAASRCSLLTGLHSGHARVRGENLVPLGPDDVTVANVMWQAGYATGLVGQWGLGDETTGNTPGGHGFENWFGSLTREHAHEYYPEYFWLNGNQIDVPENAGGAQQKYAPDALVDAALAFIDYHAQAPFFLMVSLPLPHAPLEIPDDSLYAQRDWTPQQQRYAAMVSHLDRSVGRIVDHVAAAGLDSRTVFLVTSDNGPDPERGADIEFFQGDGPLRGGKGELTEGGIRVPLVAWGPDRVPAGVVNTPYAAWDLMATLMHLCRVQDPACVTDGVPMIRMPWAEDGELPAREFLYWELHGEGSTAQAARYDSFKALRAGPGAPLELFDLATDRGESVDVAADHPEVVATIEEMMDQSHQDSPDWPLR